MIKKSLLISLVDTVVKNMKTFFFKKSINYLFFESGIDQTAKAGKTTVLTNFMIVFSMHIYFFIWADIWKYIIIYETDQISASQNGISLNNSKKIF